MIRLVGTGWSDWGSPRRVFESLAGSHHLDVLLQRIRLRSRCRRSRADGTAAAIAARMPPTDALLRQATAIANDLIGVAIGWHVLVAAVLVTVALGWRPPSRAAVLALAALPLSVAIAAAAYGNPFNAASFAILTIVLVAGSGTTTAAATAPAWARIVGGVLIAFAWVYPHFLAAPWFAYAYGAPIGVLPCPTLALLAGLTLVASGFGSRLVTGVLAAWCVFYAIFGIVRLGVWLDVGLAVGAFGLGLQTLGVRASSARPRSRGATRAGAAAAA